MSTEITSEAKAFRNLYARAEEGQGRQRKKEAQRRQRKEAELGEYKVQSALKEQNARKALFDRLRREDELGEERALDERLVREAFAPAMKAAREAEAAMKAAQEATAAATMPRGPDRGGGVRQWMRKCPGMREGEIASHLYHLRIDPNEVPSLQRVMNASKRVVLESHPDKKQCPPNDFLGITDGGEVGSEQCIRAMDKALETKKVLKDKCRF